MAACLHLVTARGVSWVMAPPIMNFYPDECWSSWAPRCPRSPAAGTVCSQPVNCLISTLFVELKHYFRKMLMKLYGQFCCCSYWRCLYCVNVKGISCVCPPDSHTRQIRDWIRFILGSSNCTVLTDLCTEAGPVPLHPKSSFFFRQTPHVGVRAFLWCGVCIWL